MNRSTINELLNNRDIKVLEQHLVHSFIENTNLNIGKSAILLDLLADFKLDREIYCSVFLLKIKELKVLENYLELLI
ncbi:MAG: DNA methyltransferase, partial [Marinirhabdus sp.]